MNIAFKLYGKQPSTELAKEALIVQAKYNLTDAQMVGLLNIHDFFQRIVLLDVPAYMVRLREHKADDTVRLPIKTIEFFKKFNKCSDACKYFNPFTAHKYFLRFADTILKDIRTTSDYIAEGLLEVVPTSNVSVSVTEYRS